MKCRSIRIRRVQSTMALIALAFAVAVPGCTSVMTYPEYPGAPRADPSLQPMPNLMADALKFAHERLAPGTELVVNLPPTTPRQVWRGVVKRDEPCRPMAATDTIAWTVQQVRLSGGKAEVDVVYPTTGIYQLATVHFAGSTGQPFYPTQLQLWLVPVVAPKSNAPEAVIVDPTGRNEPR
ncbi:MAG: hypothetical protein EXS03_06495 [Phycisphaerales bacterium]|nr:hypothetical protein [Phycisphaerales bacterium]